MISKANLGQQLALPVGEGVDALTAQHPLPIPGCRWARGQEVQGCLSGPLHHLPQFFSSPENSKHLLAQSEMKSINSSPSSTGKGRLGK